jgi:hypothetical protein
MACQAVAAATGAVSAGGSAEVSVVLEDSGASGTAGTSSLDEDGSGEGSLLFSLLCVVEVDIEERFKPRSI